MIKKYILPILAVLILTFGIAKAQTIPTVSQWFANTVGQFLYPVNSAYNVQIPAQAGTGGCAYFDTSGNLLGGATCSGGGGSGASTTINGLQPSNGVFVFATGTATGLNLNITTSSPRTLTFTPQLQNGFTIPLSASTTQWSNLVNSPTWLVGNGVIYNATSTNNVGIGTSTPGNKLTVIQTTTGNDATGLLIDGTGNAANADISLNRGSISAGESNVDFNTLGSEQWQLGLQNNSSNDFELWDGSDNPAFTINHSTLDAAFGTTTASAELTVQNESGTTPGFNVLSSAGANIFSVTASNNVQVATLTASSLVKTDANSNLQSVTLGTNLSFSGNTLNATGGGGGTPGGVSGQVQYNNAGAFAGISTGAQGQFLEQTTNSSLGFAAPFGAVTIGGTGSGAMYTSATTSIDTAYNAALTAIAAAGTGTPSTLYLLPGTYISAGNIQIYNVHDITFTGDAGATIFFSSTTGNSAFRVSTSSNITIKGMHLDGSLQAIGSFGRDRLIGTNGAVINLSINNNTLSNCNQFCIFLNNQLPNSSTTDISIDHNFLYAYGGQDAIGGGINTTNVGEENSNFSITNNYIYQTRSPGNNDYNCIDIVPFDGFTVTGNWCWGQIFMGSEKQPHTTSIVSDNHIFPPLVSGGANAADAELAVIDSCNDCSITSAATQTPFALIMNDNIITNGKIYMLASSTNPFQDIQMNSNIIETATTTMVHNGTAGACIDLTYIINSNFTGNNCHSSNLGVSTGLLLAGTDSNLTFTSNTFNGFATGFNGNGQNNIRNVFPTYLNNTTNEVTNNATINFNNNGGLGIFTSTTTVLGVTIRSGEGGGSLEIGGDVNTENSMSSSIRKISRIVEPDWAGDSTKVIELSGDINSTTTNNLYFGGAIGSSNYAMTGLHFLTGLTSTTTAGTEQMTILNNGFVGIGSTSPNSNLVIQGTGGATQPLLTVATNTNVSLFQVTAGGNVNIATLTTASLVKTDAGDNLQSVILGTNLSFSGNTLNATGGGGGTISTSTNAIIGHEADWTGSATLGNGAWLDNGTVAGFNATSSTIGVNIQGTAGTNTIFNIASSSGTSILAVSPLSYIGIGSSSPTTNLVVEGIANQTNNILTVASSSGASLVTIGVATTNGQQLSVNSSTTVNSVVYIGGSTNNPTFPLFTVASSSGLTYLQVDQWGHKITGGASPTCGTGCTSVTGDDSTFRAITGTGVTSVTVNFAHTYTTTPVCISADESGGTTVSDASSTPSSVTMNLSASLTTKSLAVICQVSQNFQN